MSYHLSEGASMEGRGSMRKFSLEEALGKSTECNSLVVTQGSRKQGL